MGRGYQNVRATGGAVKPLPWRGQRGLGCRSKPLLMKKGLGLMEDGRVKPCINKKRRSSPFTERTSCPKTLPNFNPSNTLLELLTHHLLDVCKHTDLQPSVPSRTTVSSFGCLASFYLVIWQVFIWLFGKFLFGYLVNLHLVIW